MRRTPTTLAALVAVAATTLVACSRDGRELRAPTEPLPTPTTTQPATIAPTELGREGAPPLPAFEGGMQLIAPWIDGTPIPARYTCDDVDVPPALTWTSIPAETTELAITVSDLDADGFVHWLVAGIPPTVNSLTEGALPPEAVVFTNDFGEIGWGGPCPPPSVGTHTYLFTLHALNQQLEAADDLPAGEIVSTLNQIAIEQSSVSGTYFRTG